MEDISFDVIILGTGLTESIVSAALSQARFKVAHVDFNPYYGGDEASLSVEEFIQWAQKRSGVGEHDAYLVSQRERYSSVSYSPSSLPYARQYSLSLSPSIIPSIGVLISSLVSSGVAKYGGFRLLGRVGVYNPSGVINLVPSSKDGVFKNKHLTLIDKRRIMRFLMFAGSDFEHSAELVGKETQPLLEFLQTTFSLAPENAMTIACALAHCSSPSEPALSALLRVRRYIRSAGRYGASSFLVGHYGGLGEIAQGFCRTSAVYGSTYILGRRIETIVANREADNPPTNNPYKYNVTLEDVPDVLKCDLIISSHDYLSPALSDSADYVMSENGRLLPSIARAIAIVDQLIVPNTNHSGPSSTSSDPDDSSWSEAQPCIVVFPPSSVSQGSSTFSVTALIDGEGTMSAPKGKKIIYLSMPLMEKPASSAESLLRPYLDALFSLPEPKISPLFTAFYFQHPPPTPPPPQASTSPPPASTSPPPTSVIVTPALMHLFSESGDSAAAHAETVFRRALPILRASRRGRHASSDETDCDDDVDAFWRPLAQEDESIADEGW